MIQIAVTEVCYIRESSYGLENIGKNQERLTYSAWAQAKIGIKWEGGGGGGVTRAVSADGAWVGAFILF